VIYMIQAGENGPVKIGVTDNLESRLCKMQVDNAAPLKVLRLLAGGFAQEAELHIRFSDINIRGEWFSFSRLMLGNLEMEDIPFTAPATEPIEFIRESQERIPVSILIERAGGCALIGRSMGMSHSAVLGWRITDTVPVLRVRALSKMARVSAHLIRPDIYTPSDSAAFEAAA
jgi:hypothetical protein